MKNFNLTKAIIPNTFTALNSFCGFLSIVFASQGNYDLAAYAIFGAAFFDAADGIIARMVGTSSRFGVELDSLSDVVSFGAAPSLLIYFLYFNEFGFIGIILSSLVLLFGSFRLARFNVQLEDLTNKSDFKGLPIPVAALTLTSFVFAFHKNNTVPEPYSYFVIPLVVLVSLLMVSQVKYDTLPQIFKQTPKERVITALLFLSGLFIVILTAGTALFYIFISIVLFGILRKMISFFFNSKQNEEITYNEETN
ncbi:MAG: CDP-diacylglycerol--serine O-phosphatidyltransferase [Bacteroidetes bacterium]|nr:CDP-diacylglycerol--serine O-phosphatidyltransferase [Bacteroidota bacterium]